MVPMSFEDFLSSSLASSGSLHGNLPGYPPTDSQAMAAMRSNFGNNNNNAYNRRNDPLLPNGSLNKQPFKHGDNTYYLAPRPSADSDRETKARVYEDAVNEIKNGSGTYKDKITALSGHFQMQTMVTNVKQMTQELNNVNGPYFQWTFVGLSANDFTDVPLPLPGNDIPNGVKYVRFDLIIDPTNFPAFVSRSDCPRPTTKTGILVKLEPDPNVPGQLHPNYTLNNIQNYGTLHAVTTTIPVPPVAGWVSRPPIIGARVSADSPFSVESFNKWKEEKYNECVFQSAVEVIRTAYVGHGALSTALSRLQNLRQTSTSQGRVTTLSVETYFEKFQNLVNELNPNESYGLIASTFFHNLNDKIKDHMTSSLNFLPDSTPTSNHQEVGRLLVVRDVAVRAESALRSTVETATAILHQGRRGGNTNTLMSNPTGVAFMAQQGFNNPMLPMFDNQGPGTNQGFNQGFNQGYNLLSSAQTTPEYNTGHFGIVSTNSFEGQSPSTNVFLANQAQLPLVSPTPQRDNGINATELALAQAYLAHELCEGEDLVDRYLQICETLPMAQAFLSTAEKALRSASGSNSPLECWGCTNDSRFHAKRFHRFMQCPNKHDPQVRARANEYMKRLFGDKRGTKKRDSTAMVATDSSAYLTGPEITEQWKALGFKSQAQAALVSTLIARDTNTKIRKRMEVMEFNPNDNRNIPSFMIIPMLEDISLTEPGVSNPRVLQGIPHVLNLDVTRFLPHIELPIGKNESVFTLKTAADTCAGVNIGELNFHQRICQLYPEMVASLVDLTTTGQHIQIGGVGREGGGLIISHEVTYYMPFHYQGKNAKITFGLSKDSAASCLVGIGFFQKTRAIMSFSSPQEPTMVLQAINHTLPVKFEQPAARPAPIRKDAAHAYAALKEPMPEDDFVNLPDTGDYGETPYGPEGDDEKKE